MISSEFTASDRALLIRFVHGYVSNFDTAEDIAHDALLRAQRYEWRGESRFTTWLYKIAKNLCVDYYERRHRRPQKTELEAAELIQDPRSSVMEELLDACTREHVVKGMSALSEADQELLRIRYYKGLKFREIAELQGEKLSTVKNRMSRIKVRLKQKLLN